MSFASKNSKDLNKNNLKIKAYMNPNETVWKLFRTAKNLGLFAVLFFIFISVGLIIAVFSYSQVANEQVTILPSQPNIPIPVND